MGFFFKPWRRKLGVVALVMACVFAAGWVRSETKLDNTQTGTAESTHSLISMDGNLYWFRLNPMPNGKTIIWQSADIRRPPLSPWDAFDPVSQIKVAEFEFAIGQHKTLSTIKMHLWIIPYWSVVIPLTLISLWLLVTKPRKSNQEKFDEPLHQAVA